MEINRNTSTLFYEKIGTGRENLLFFHGFGQDHTTFQTAIANLSGDYTCYSFDLFFHGRSVWGRGEHPLELKEWSIFMADFFEKETVASFSVVAFSLGARLALATYESFPDKVAKLVLIAPDGVQRNGWYELATSSALMRNVFRTMIDRPGVFNRLNSVAVRVKLVHPVVSRFASAQMNTAEKRSRVFLSWVVFRKLFFDFDRILKLIRKNKTKVILYLGKNDRVVKSHYAERFAQSIERSTVKVLETHHHKLLEEVAALLPADLKGQNEIQR